MMRHQLSPRLLSARQLLTIGWDRITEGAQWWQEELLLGECALMVGEHDSAVERLDSLRASGKVPKDQFTKVRRALFNARRRQRGLPVEW